MPVQVNGKVRGHVTLPRGAPESVAREASLGVAGVRAAMGGKAIRRFVYVPDTIINVVV